ncbi:MAG: TetR/AcrR family transcriptional regulator [Bacteroidales bacterium]|nr:TetR/AcrR family transcriptional regulator [Bacteroidales bacterium]MCF8389910.1 TetR/AcrR family transcriptional regulator [Bacteroidales bacterium]
MQDVNVKYLDIVAAGKELFWKFGLKKVSIAEICEHAKLSRATFYKYFENKEKLAIYILKTVIDDGVKEYQDIMNAEIDFEKKVEKTILFKLDRTKDFSQEFLNDLYKGEFKELNSYFLRVTSDNIEMIENDYRQAQFDGHIRSDIKIEFIMFNINKMFEMMTDEKLSSLYLSPTDLIAEMIRFFFYGILPREK